MKKIHLSVLMMVVLCFSVAHAALPGFQVVGYFPSWSASNDMAALVRAGTLNPQHLTAINYAFLDICWNGQHGNVAAEDKAIRDCQDGSGEKINAPDGAVVLGDPALDAAFSGFGVNYLGQLLTLKTINPDIRLFASVGGWAGSNQFSRTAATEETRRNFAESAVSFLRTYQFDGIDIDWEYPTASGLACEAEQICQDPADKKNYILLVQTLRAALDHAGLQDGKKYLITIAAGASQTFLQDAVDSVSASWLRTLAGSLDWVNLMNYDYHGPWENRSGHIAPLGYDARDKGASARSGFSDAIIKRYLLQVPAHKLVLGQAFYGYGWSGCAAGLRGDGLYQPCSGPAIGLTDVLINFASYTDAGLSDLLTLGRVPESGLTDFFRPADQNDSDSTCDCYPVGSLKPNINFSDLTDRDYLVIASDGNYTSGGQGFIRYWNSAAQSPYLYNPASNIFVTFEDEESIHAKNKFIIKNGLGGAMLWELTADRKHILGRVVARDLLGK